MQNKRMNVAVINPQQTHALGRDGTYGDAFFHDKPLLTPMMIGAFLAVSAIHDRIIGARIHPVSLWVALAMFVLDNLCVAVVMPNPAWHAFASRLVR